MPVDVKDSVGEDASQVSESAVTEESSGEETKNAREGDAVEDPSTEDDTIDATDQREEQDAVTVDEGESAEESEEAAAEKAVWRKEAMLKAKVRNATTYESD